MTRGTPRTSLRLDPSEKQHLKTLADKAGVSLSDAMRTGTRLYLETLAQTKPAAQMGRRSKS